MHQERRTYLAPSNVVGPTIEAVILNAISGLLAQAFNAYKAKVGQRFRGHLGVNLTLIQDVFAVDLVHIAQFMAFTALVTAPNYIFQSVLEDRFPSRTVPPERLEALRAKGDSKDEEAIFRTHARLNIRNTVIKFVLDQSLSATTNTALFIVLLGSIKGQSFDYIQISLYKVSRRECVST